MTDKELMRLEDYMDFTLFDSNIGNNDTTPEFIIAISGNE